jgi:hypothetical protein
LLNSIAPMSPPGQLRYRLIKSESEKQNDLSAVFIVVGRMCRTPALRLFSSFLSSRCARGRSMDALAHGYATYVRRLRGGVPQGECGAFQRESGATPDGRITEPPGVAQNGGGQTRLRFISASGWPGMFRSADSPGLTALVRPILIRRARIGPPPPTVLRSGGRRTPGVDVPRGRDRERHATCAACALATTPPSTADGLASGRPSIPARAA